MSYLKDNICCTPTRTEKKSIVHFKIKSSESQINKSAIEVPGGSSIIGTNSPLIFEDDEGPARKIKIKPYKI